MCARQGVQLSPSFDSSVGVNQGGPMSPLLFGPDLDGIACSTSSQEEDEVACATRCTAERCAFDTGVDVGGQRYRMLLYADTVVCIHN
jgi:hypothetical protein